MSKIRIQTVNMTTLSKPWEWAVSAIVFPQEWEQFSDMNGWFVHGCPPFIFMLYHRWFSSKEYISKFSSRSVYLRDSLILVLYSYICFGLNFWEIVHISVFCCCLFYNQDSKGLHISVTFFMHGHNMSPKLKQVLCDWSLMTGYLLKSSNIHQARRELAVPEHENDISHWHKPVTSR